MLQIVQIGAVIMMVVGAPLSIIGLALVEQARRT